jgi:hypothetical protein
MLKMWQRVRVNSNENVPESQQFPQMKMFLKPTSSFLDHRRPPPHPSPLLPPVERLSTAPARELRWLGRSVCAADTDWFGDRAVVSGRAALETTFLSLVSVGKAFALCPTRGEPCC